MLALSRSGGIIAIDGARGVNCTSDGYPAYRSRAPLALALRAQEEEDDAMQESEVHVYARQLWKARGPRAIAEAAHRAVEFEKKRDREQADHWRRIEAILMQMRGPSQT